jgi:hypothetical protein
VAVVGADLDPETEGAKLCDVLATVVERFADQVGDDPLQASDESHPGFKFVPQPVVVVGRQIE